MQALQAIALSPIEYSLLGLLAGGPAHAYLLHARMARAESLGLVWQVKQPHLYALLGRLEERGYLEADTERQAGRPSKRVLRLTAEGTDALLDWVSSPVGHGRDFRIEFLSKLYFARELGGEAAAVLLRKQRGLCSLQLDQLRSHAASAPQDKPYDRLVYEFRAGQMSAILDWLDLCEAYAPESGRDA